MAYVLSLDDEPAEFTITREAPLRSASVDELKFKRRKNSDGGSEWEFETASGEGRDFFSAERKCENTMPPVQSQRPKRRGRRPQAKNEEHNKKKESKPLRRKSRRNSLLHKFLGSSKGKQVSSGGGSTTSGETMSNNADNSEELHNSCITNSNPVLRSLAKIVRRGSMDSTTSNKSGRRISIQGSLSSNGAMLMSPEEYKIAIANLQVHANELEDNGKPDEALDIWQEALELADERTDALATKTEILCKLVVLHLFIANEQEELHSSLQFIVKDESKDENRRQMLARENSRRLMQGLKETVHHQAAKRYLIRIKPKLVQPGWLLGTPTKASLLDFLHYAEAWELAIFVTKELQLEEKGKEDFQELATIHYKVACQKLDAQKHEDALSHLQSTATYLQKVPKDELDMTLYTQVLHLLANEYQSQQEYGSALEIYKEEMLFAPLDQKASLYCQMAQVYIAVGMLDSALEQIESAEGVQQKVAESNDSIRCQILHTRGDVFFRLGRIEDSLECYQEALHELDSSPADKAKLLYTMGKICVKLGRVRSAITYFTRELEITKQELGPSHLSVSRILHELAKLYDRGLGEHKVAIRKLKKALAVEWSNLTECHASASACPHCNRETHELCSRHASWKRQITAQIQETKKAQGLIYYKLGDFERAMKTSFIESSSSRGRRHSLY